MRPLLAFGADGQERNINAAIDALADEFHLTPENRELLLPSGKQRVFANRVHWARTYLDKAGALKRTRRSHFVVTDRGRELLKQNPDRVDARTLRQFAEFLAFQTPRVESGEAEESDQVEKQQSIVELSSATPEETLQAAEDTISASLRTQLLARVLELSPALFERLVVDLIIAMGYGGSRASVVQRLGKSGDEGIDGIVNEDPLGLDVVYIQAKRYASDNTVGRERIQQFAGALVGQGATKGVFVTTSSFTRGASEFALRIPQKIILVDGNELTRLMMQYGVGVRTERTIELKRIDLDYFEEMDD
ncbi:restriction endonuclease [Bradyrhizobium arachidis]|uniref:restriction endonuclease n=1 Tax=Bradyrhizobium arachidis TaxID=858423 RepID=UPI00216229D7|nr:restriction endonuclease [Bradyrhizobium arachidis]UVO32263.1 restriction endonuclease [Bradyrhizobium arachidis]